MQSTHHTREGEGESRREKRGRATGQRLVRTHTDTHTHGSSRTRAGRYVAAGPTRRDFRRRSGTNGGLTVLGCFKAEAFLSYQVAASLRGTFGVSGVSFQTPAKSDYRI